MRWGFAKGVRKVKLGTYGPLVIGPGFSLDERQLANHVHIIGLTGQGKSKAIASVAVQLLRQGYTIYLIDPHADLARDVLRILIAKGYFADPRAWQRLWYLDLTRQDRFIAWNVLDQPYAPHATTRQAVDSLTRAWPALGEGAAPQFENIMAAGVFVLVENGLPLTQLPELLTSKPYREQLLARVTDPQIVHFFHDRYDRWGREAPTMIESSLRRIFLLTFSPALRYSLGQRGNKLPFRELMDRGVSLIVNLGGLDEQTQRFLGCLLTVGLEVAALSRADMAEEKRSKAFLIMDEFSMFSAQSEEALARVLSLTRKYGLHLIMAHQTWSQISTRLQGALQNCVKMAFKLGREDAEQEARRFTRYDPYLLKHEVADLVQAERTHPVYFSLTEQQEATVDLLTRLRPRECVVKVGDQVAKLRTLTVETKVDAEQLAAVEERYAQMLLTPSEEIARELNREPPPRWGAGVARLVDEPDEE